jgi:hypothetical protein
MRPDVKPDGVTRHSSGALRGIPVTTTGPRLAIVLLPGSLADFAVLCGAAEATGSIPT